MSQGDSEKIRQLEETIRSLTRDLHNMQTTIHGINQRLYVTVMLFSIYHVQCFNLCKVPTKTCRTLNLADRCTHTYAFLFINVYAAGQLMERGCLLTYVYNSFSPPLYRPGLNGAIVPADSAQPHMKETINSIQTKLDHLYNRTQVN